MDEKQILSDTLNKQSLSDTIAQIEATSGFDGTVPVDPADPAAVPASLGCIVNQTISQMRQAGYAMLHISEQVQQNKDHEVNRVFGKVAEVLFELMLNWSSNSTPENMAGVVNVLLHRLVQIMMNHEAQVAELIQYDVSQFQCDASCDPAYDPANNGTYDPANDGTADGTADGSADGSSDGTADGSSDPSADGSSDPSADGSSDPAADGSSDPAADGSA